MGAIDDSIEAAAELMNAFADRTGLTSDRPSRRYLWTDAFAVCNYLELSRLTGQTHYARLALELVDQVHHVLGRHRDDDPRHGWLSGANEADGEAHPTSGGLRIGKPLSERREDEPIDDRLEWERDGQYFHYLTKWMYALDQVSRSTGSPRFTLWARELADVAHRSFTHRASASDRPRMVWKMSIALSRPLVASMGQHDPLDGWITALQLDATSRLLPGAAGSPDLTRAADDFAQMLSNLDIRTADPLGLGGLLADAWRVSQLVSEGALRNSTIFEPLLDAAGEGLSLCLQYGDWQAPSSQRLAFRELGLAIGLSAVERFHDWVEEHPRDVGADVLRERVRSLMPDVAARSEIVSFWLDPEHRASELWSEHKDINEVMLATSLIPRGYLDLRPAADETNRIAPSPAGR